MKYCKKCGLNLADDTKFCPECGCDLNNSHQESYMDEVYKVLNNQSSSDDHKSFGWALIGFLFPIIGLILYLVWRDDRPLRARSVGKGALMCVVIPIIVLVILVVIGLLAS